jgi:hypothetical protein
MRQQLKSAEQAARALKEEMARMKMLVAQTRAQCANEVRKRERTIEGMKKHVAEGGRARGTGKMVGSVTINVTAGIGAESSNANALGTDESAYDLRMETNEFLTELARGLSEENEHMGGLVRKTVETLKMLSGCDKDGPPEKALVVQVENGYEALSAEMDIVIDHVRTLLTNPSFVPLEEVEVREEEIIRLREGWERMESRWREAVQMMDGWRKRMAVSGQTVNLEELKMGIRLSPFRSKTEDSTRAFQLSTLVEDGEGDTQADIDAMDDTDMQEPEEVNVGVDSDDSDSSLMDDDPLDEQSEDVSEERNHEASFNTISSASPGPPPQLSPLKETTKGNRGVSHEPLDTFTENSKEDIYELLQLNNSSPRKLQPVAQSPPQRGRRQTPTPSEDEVALLKTSNTQKQASSPTKQGLQAPAGRASPIHRMREDTGSKLPRPKEALPQQSPLTMASIAAKLAATEREADAARVRAKLKAARMKSASNAEALKLNAPQRKASDEMEPSKVERDNREHANDVPETRKRKAPIRQGGRASRRRSTLSPWELESLIQGTVVKGAD